MSHLLIFLAAEQTSRVLILLFKNL